MKIITKILALCAALCGMSAGASTVVQTDTSFVRETETNTLPDGWTGYQYNGSSTTPFTLGANGAVVTDWYKQNALDTSVTVDYDHETTIDVVTYTTKADANAVIYLSSDSYSVCIGNSYTSNSKVYVGTLDSAASGSNVSFQNNTGKNPTVKATYTTVDVGKPLTYHLVIKAGSLTGTVTDGTNTDNINVDLGVTSYTFTKAGVLLDGETSNVGVKSFKVETTLRALYHGSASPLGGTAGWTASSKFSLDPDYPNEETTTLVPAFDEVNFTESITTYISKSFTSALNIKIDAGKTVTFGHDNYNYNNNKNLNDGSVITMEDGAVTMFGFWGNGRGKGHAVVGDITVNGGTIKQDVANCDYLEMGTISGSTTIDTTSNSDSNTADIRATAVNGTVTGTGSLTLSGGDSELTAATSTPITLGESTTLQMSVAAAGGNKTINVTGAGDTSVVTLKPTGNIGLNKETVFEDVKLVIDGTAKLWIGTNITAENVDLVVNSAIQIERTGTLTVNTISGSANIEEDVYGGAKLKLTGTSTFNGGISTPIELAHGVSLTLNSQHNNVTTDNADGYYVKHTVTTEGKHVYTATNKYTVSIDTGIKVTIAGETYTSDKDYQTEAGELEFTAVAIDSEYAIETLKVGETTVTPDAQGVYKATISEDVIISATLKAAGTVVTDPDGNPIEITEEGNALTANVIFTDASKVAIKIGGKDVTAGFKVSITDGVMTAVLDEETPETDAIAQILTGKDGDIDVVKGLCYGVKSGTALADVKDEPETELNETGKLTIKKGNFVKIRITTAPAAEVK